MEVAERKIKGRKNEEKKGEDNKQTKKKETKGGGGREINDVWEEPTENTEDSKLRGISEARTKTRDDTNRES